MVLPAVSELIPSVTSTGGLYLSLDFDVFWNEEFMAVVCLIFFIGFSDNFSAYEYPYIIHRTIVLHAFLGCK